MVTILLVSLDAFLVLMFREAMADAWNVDLIDMIGLPELIRFVTGEPRTRSTPSSQHGQIGC